MYPYPLLKLDGYGGKRAALGYIDRSLYGVIRCTGCGCERNGCVPSEAFIVPPAVAIGYVGGIKQLHSHTGQGGVGFSVDNFKPHFAHPPFQRPQIAEVLYVFTDRSLGIIVYTTLEYALKSCGSISGLAS